MQYSDIPSFMAKLEGELHGLPNVKQRRIANEVRAALNALYRSGFDHGRTLRPEKKPGWLSRR